MKITELPSYTACMTIGQREGYHGEIINKIDLHKKIKEFQDDLAYKGAPNCAVKIVESKLQFRGYYEFCWDISIIQYPRFPRKPGEMNEFMLSLAKFLLTELKQNRITVCLPSWHVLIESDDAEQNA